jgi:hypothetical protein
MEDVKLKPIVCEIFSRIHNSKDVIYKRPSSNHGNARELESQKLHGKRHFTLKNGLETLILAILGT